ncbi:hypothetical protein CDD81_416 [Ophiocordyceps australis]|uniref:Nudix hydrolase domain-containing protein n=1 Tax=Ophiocordyceps australis TaxID=1399860 RepID=A0A2C5Y3C8_9HYPO|nr:hypothetical protein CDD81_416 [Ophiocordyceps australis]
MKQPKTAPPFAFDDSLAEYNQSAKTWLSRNASQVRLDGIATSTLIFNANGKVLLVQRASTDSMPNKWEAPGGAVDSEDASILHGAAREMWEESGLVARRFVCRVTLGPGSPDLDIFHNSTRTRCLCRFAFLVEAESCEGVQLDAKEHQAHVWATEEQVREQRQVTMTNSSMQALVLEAFRLRREEQETTA